MPDPKPWPDEVLRSCSEICDSSAVMMLLDTLRDGTVEQLVADMRGAVASGDYSRAASLEAQAHAWEEMPGTIRYLADEWRQQVQWGKNGR